MLDKKLHYKLLFYPDLYFGEAYANGTAKIENGSLTDFLDMALKNIGRSETNFFSELLSKLRGSYRYFTNFNIIKKSKMNVAHHYNISDIFMICFLIQKNNIRVLILKMKKIA